MASIRETEAGDIRITEDGDTRAIEGSTESFVGFSSLQASPRSSVLGQVGLEKGLYLDFLDNNYTVKEGADAEGSLLASAGLVIIGEFKPFFESFERITEAEDTRITESGDTRITGLSEGNEAKSNLLVTANAIPYSTELYAKYLGNWKVAIPFVKDNGIWKRPEIIYRYTDNAWKRIN